MRTRFVVLVLIVFVFVSCYAGFTANAQKQFGFKLPEKAKYIKIPFELHNNLIIIPITINGFVKLKFILDTGVETAILTEKLFADILNVNYVREITVEGPGLMDSVRALVANELIFSLPGGIVGTNMNLLVLKEDYLELAENLGDDVHGIIGYDIFSRFIVSVDYDKKILRLSDPTRFQKKMRMEVIPLEIKNSKPFISTYVKHGDEQKRLDILMDTGASHAVLLDYHLIEGFELPEQRIVTRLGRGIAGEIPGYIVRIDSVIIDKFGFDNVLVSAPFDGAYNKAIKRGSREGTFGGELLSRFNVTFDYHHKRLYLSKGEKYKEKFEYDMSGLTLNATGRFLDTLKVVSITQESTADKAGIKVGDVIKSINGRSIKDHSLTELSAILREGDGKKIKVKIDRNGETLRKSFLLKRII